jgi:CheY-like chemotaxis protein
MMLISEIKADAKILLVDDSTENIFSLTKLLEVNGYNVVSVTSGSQALKEVYSNDYDLLLLDVNMPDMNGFEVAEALKEVKRTSHLPIIFLTAMDKNRSLEYLSETGPVDFITKPFDTDHFFLKINNFLRFNFLYKERFNQKET